MTETIKTKPRKSRPKLQPVAISPDQSFDDLDDEGGKGLGFGFDDIMTVKSSTSAKDKDDGSMRMSSPPATTVSPSDDGSGMMNGDIVKNGAVSNDKGNKDVTDVERRLFSFDGDSRDDSARKPSGAFTPATATATTTVTAVDCMAKYSSITSPSAVNLDTLCFDDDDSVDSNQDDDEDKDDQNQIPQKSSTRSKLASEKMALELSSMDSETHNNDGILGIKRDDDGARSNMTSPGTVVDLFSSEKSSSSDESSSDESSVSSNESESDVSDIDVADDVTQLQQLQSEIRTRQKQLTKILRGREGTVYSRMIQEQEDVVNAQLMRRCRVQEQQQQQHEPMVPISEKANKALLETIRNNGTKPSPSSASTSEAASKDSETKNDDSKTTYRDPFRTIQAMILEGYYHTLPGAISLVLHCILYVTIYGIINKLMMCSFDAYLVHYTGWHASKNSFDFSPYENAFYFGSLVLSLLATKVTGAVYDWNENRSYQKVLEFHFRNKWFLKCWDVRVMNYFLGGELRDEYDKESSRSGGGGGSSSTTKQEEAEAKMAKLRRKKRFGPKLKYLLDVFAFFVCYKCIDHFVLMGVITASDVTESILDGLPSRQLQELRVGHSVQNGHSYACSSVMSALDNRYALDMLEWMAHDVEIKSEEAQNWIVNAKKCGWSGSSEEKVGDDTVVGVNGTAGSSESDDESDHPAFLRQKRVMSHHDEEYLQEKISTEAYWELVGMPSPTFLDSSREVVFLLISTATCTGLLYLLGIPFLAF